MVQSQIINYILSKSDDSILINNQITLDFFTEYSQEINYIHDHKEQYGNIPDKETFLEKFPDFDIIEVSETERYLVDTIREEHLYSNAVPIVKKFAELLKSDSNEAAEYLRTQMQYLQPNYSIGGIDITKQSDIRYTEYTERKDNQKAFYFDSGFKELDDIIHGIQRGEELIVLVARLGNGKCLQKGTKVLMADGTLKNVEDVAVGDYVQSLGRANRVEYLHNGISNGYRIIPKLGEPFVVSSQHILTLKVLKEFYDKRTGHMTTCGEYDLVDVTIEDYLKWSNHKKRRASLYRPAVEYAEKEQTIPPYILGSWIGDGYAREVTICNPDEEVISEWREYAHKNGLELVQRCDKLSYGISGENKKPNTVLRAFKDLGVINNKHIPLNYLTGSREQRLELLAGLLDTDGYYSEENLSYEITFKSRELIEQTAQLCRGLGLRVGQIQSKYNSKYNKDYYRITIKGNLSIIPTRVKRKQSNVSSNTEVLTRFTVEEVPLIEYYGFQVDGDNRYLLWDNTLTHNTWCLLKMAVSVWAQRQSIGYISPEMSYNTIGYRIDTLLGHFSNTNLMHGNDEESYHMFIDELKEKENKFVVATPKDFNKKITVSKLRNFVQQYNLQALFIDGIKYLSDERGRKNDNLTTSLTNISEDLMELSVELEIPVIVVVQANRGGVSDANEDDTPELESIRDSDGIAHNASKVISLKQKADGVLVMSVKKNRFGKFGSSVSYSWDIDHGVFSYISTNDGTSRRRKPEGGEETTIRPKNTGKNNVF